MQLMLKPVLIGLSFILSNLSIGTATAQVDVPLDLHNRIAAESCINGSTQNGDVIYLWHIWGGDSARLSLKTLDGEYLKDLPSPKGYEKYANWASIDIRPSTFWEYMASEPQFTWRGDTINTWFWCSEIESAYVAALTTFGYEAHVVLAGGHTWTEVQIGDTLYQVDNTFNEFIPIQESTYTPNQYDRLAHNPEQLRRVAAILEKTDICLGE